MDKRFFDLRLTVCSMTVFVRLFCQYPNTTYYIMLAATLPRRDLFSVVITPEHIAALKQRFQRWKPRLGAS